MLENQEILKKLIIEKIPNVKKINSEFFPVFPDVYFIKEPKKSQKEPKIVKKCQIFGSFMKCTSGNTGKNSELIFLIFGIFSIMSFFKIS